MVTTLLRAARSPGPGASPQVAVIRARHRDGRWVRLVVVGARRPVGSRPSTGSRCTSRGPTERPVSPHHRSRAWPRWPTPSPPGSWPPTRPARSSTPTPRPPSSSGWRRRRCSSTAGWPPSTSTTWRRCRPPRRPRCRASPTRTSASSCGSTPTTPAGSTPASAGCAPRPGATAGWLPSRTSPPVGRPSTSCRSRPPTTRSPGSPTDCSSATASSRASPGSTATTPSSACCSSISTASKRSTTSTATRWAMRCWSRWPGASPARCDRATPRRGSVVTSSSSWPTTSTRPAHWRSPIGWRARWPDRSGWTRSRSPSARRSA